MSLKERLTPSESSGLAAKPIEIFPGQQEIQKPPFKKTRLMREVEQVIKEDLPEFLEINYSVKDLSQRDIAQIITNKSEGHIQIKGAHIHYWLKSFNVVTRSRPEGVKLALQNPDKRKSIIKKIHSPSSDTKRSKTMSKNWQGYSRLEKESRLRPAREGNRAAMLSRMRGVLGENPAERLNEMYWQQELSATKIGEELGRSPNAVLEWMRFLGIEAREQGKSTQGIGFIKAKKEEKQNRVEQARVKGLVEMLTEKEQLVINARFPTKGEIISLTQIGQKLDPNRPVEFSRENIRQIQEKALGKLETMLNTA